MKENIMNEQELDSAYTLLCKTMTGLGEEKTSLFLARFALLAMQEIGRPDALRRLIEAAATDIG
jgi:hypothetical protein